MLCQVDRKLTRLIWLGAKLAELQDSVRVIEGRLETLETRVRNLE